MEGRLDEATLLAVCLSFQRKQSLADCFGHVTIALNRGEIAWMLRQNVAYMLRSKYHHYGRFAYVNGHHIAVSASHALHIVYLITLELEHIANDGQCFGPRWKSGKVCHGFVCPVVFCAI